MIISKLYKVGDIPVFYSTGLTEVRQEYFDGLLNGDLIGYSTDGTEMESSIAAKSFIFMCDYMDCESTVEQIYRNMKVATIIIAIVKDELLENDNPESCLITLNDVILALQTGSLTTASVLCANIEVTDVFTEDRLTRWSELCSTADAIK